MVMSCHFHLHWSDWWSLVSHRRRIGFRRMLLGIPQASEQASRFVASGASSRRGQPVSPRSDSADLTLAMEKTEGWEGNIVVMLWKSCSLYPREVIVCCLMLSSYVFHFHLHLLSQDYHRLSFFLNFIRIFMWLASWHVSCSLAMLALLLSQNVLENDAELCKRNNLNV